MSDMEIKGSPAHKDRSVRSSHPVVLAVSALGIVSIALLVWMHQINRREDADILVADAIMDLEVDVASSHFKLEESFHGHLSGRDGIALADLDRAIAQSRAIQGGGQSKFGSNLIVLNNPQFSAEVQNILRVLLEMKGIAQQLIDLPPQSPVPMTLDSRFDELCDEVLDRAKALELDLEKKGTAHRNNSRDLVYWIFFAWSGVVAGSTIGLWNRERQRRDAEAAILKLNAHLEMQTEELTRHREHAIQLVEERTARLKLANEGLRTEMAERQETEKALRKSEERYRMLIETMSEGLTILDEKGTLEYVNDRFCEMLGLPRTEILGHPLLKFIAFHRDMETASEHLRKISTAESSRFEVAFFTWDGRVVSTITSIRGIQDTDGKRRGCLAVITDITEKVSLQASSLRSAHLASLGEMAASVAHEINNPINGIINYARLLCAAKNTAEQETEIAGRIQTEGRRIAGIVKDLLLFGRPGTKEKVPVSVNEILLKALDLTGAGLRNDGIEIRTSLAEDLPKPIIDSQELQRVFINLLSNAQHALNEKYPDRHENKILEIRSERNPADQLSYVRVVFRDRGTGIPARIKDKVKQPFFSTRPKGKGTGLGLSICEGIINECSGKLTIESVEGEFTNILIDLPAGLAVSNRAV